MVCSLTARSRGDANTVDTFIANFNSVYPDIHVTVEYLDYTNGDDQINTAIEGNQAPDIVLEGPERLVANRDARGLMADLEYLDEEKGTWTTENFQKAIQAVYDNGQQNVGAVYFSGQGGDQETRALINRKKD